MNRVEVSGRVTRDPEIRYVGATQFPICSLNVAVDDGSGRWDRDSKKTMYESGFYQVEVAGTYAVSVFEGVLKGDYVYVVGSLGQWRKQPKDGGESETKTRIHAVMVQPLTRTALPPQREQIEPPDAPLFDEPAQAAGWEDPPF